MSRMISKETIDIVKKFRDDRNWSQFHNPKDLAISLNLEAAELLEIFQWSGSDLERLEKLDEVILENLTDDTFGSKQMEEALFMSRSTLARKIREIYDMTPNDYLKHKRLSVATQMLLNKNVRINEVARAVGFRSASYFTKCFKAEYGVLPAEYINEKNK